MTKEKIYTLYAFKTFMNGMEKEIRRVVKVLKLDNGE
jgi:hypothetical protein